MPLSISTESEIFGYFGVQSFSFGHRFPKLKLWIPSVVGVQSFSFGLAALPKLKLWIPSAFDVKSKKLEHRVLT